MELIDKLKSNLEAIDLKKILAKITVNRQFQIGFVSLFILVLMIGGFFIIHLN